MLPVGDHKGIIWLLSETNWLPSICLSVALCHFSLYSFVYSAWGVSITYCHKNAVLQTTTNLSGLGQETFVLLLCLWGSVAGE